MEAKEWTTIDKAEWPRGEWDNEPDKAQWPDPVTGMACLAVRNECSGNWCGYVGVPHGHKYHEVDYTECPQGCGESYCAHSAGLALDVHGGITFASACQDTDDESRHICHIDSGGDGVWWLGFDCNHAGDFPPGTAAISGSFRAAYPDVYRSLAYVREQCASLAEQLATIEGIER